jgi:phospholipid transport system transporter-binding protein
MPKQADIVLKNNVFLLSGELDMTNVMFVFNKSMQQIPSCETLFFDLSQLKSSDSTGLALVMEWLKYAKRHEKPIAFYHFFPGLLSIAQAAGMEQWIAALVLS